MECPAPSADFERYSQLCATLIRSLLLRCSLDDADVLAMVHAINDEAAAIAECFQSAGRDLQQFERRSADVADFALLRLAGDETPDRIIAPTAHLVALALLDELLSLVLPERIEQYTDELIDDEICNGLQAFLLDTGEARRLLARMDRERWSLCPESPSPRDGGGLLVTIEQLSFATAGSDGLPRIDVKTIRSHLSLMPGSRPVPVLNGPPAVYAYADWTRWWKGAGFSRCQELPAEADARRLIRVVPQRLCGDSLTD
jgi:hypothetical protein